MTISAYVIIAYQTADINKISPPEDIYPWSFHDEILTHNSAIFQPVIFNPIKTRLHNTDHTIRTREYKDYSNHWKKPRKRERGGQLEANSFNLIALLH